MRAARFAFALGTLLLFACGRDPQHQPDPAAAPPAGDGAADLVLVTLDTVRADRLGCYGHAAAETPHLDALAARGLRFENAMTSAPLTAPAHATLFSGLYPPRHGVHTNGIDRLPPDTFHLAEHLAERGYVTAAFVGAFVLDERFGLGRGFEVYDDDLGPSSGSGATLEAARTADVVVDRAVEWLAAAERRRPVFLWVHLWDAHAPYSPPEPFRSRHAASPYDGEIAFVDEQVGRLLAAVDARARPALVAVAADHGEALDDHGERSHGLLLYEPTLRVPLLVAGPGLPSGVTIDSPVGLVDLAPTLAGLVGQPVADASAGGGIADGDPESRPAADRPDPGDGDGRAGLVPPPLDGRDLSRSLLRGEPIPPAELYAETRYPSLFGWSPMAAVRYRSAKYVHSPRPELFDLDTDPGEARNLAGERRELATRLAGSLASLAQAERAAVAPAKLDEETRARLAALGYLGSGAAPAKTAIAATGIDPKDRVAAFRAFEEARWASLEGRWQDALERLEPLVEAEPRNPVFRSQLAEASRRVGNHAAAERHYRALLEREPEHGETWYHYGVALQEQGRNREAVDAFARAIELEPDRASAHNILGIAHLALGRLEDAHAAFATAVEKEPTDARAWNNLGNAARDLGRATQAEAAYREASVLDPSYSDPLNGLGTLLVRERRPREALELFDRALALRPDHLEVLLNRAIALDVLGDRERAIEVYRGFLEAAAGRHELDEQRRSAAMLLRRLEASPPS